jgi:hypothetical protein
MNCALHPEFLEKMRPKKGGNIPNIKSVSKHCSIYISIQTHNSKVSHKNILK